MARWTTKDLDALHLEWDEKGSAMSETERRDLFLEIMGPTLAKVGEMKRVQATLGSERKSRFGHAFLGGVRHLWNLLLEMAEEEERFRDWLSQHPGFPLHDRVEVAGTLDRELAAENLVTLKEYLSHRGPAAFHSWRFGRHLERECGYLDKVVDLEISRPNSPARTASRNAKKAALAAFTKAEFDRRKKVVARADACTPGLTDPVEIARQLRKAGLFGALLAGDSIPELIARGRRPRRGRNRLPVETIAMASMILSGCSLDERPSLDEAEVLAEKRIRKMLGDRRQRR